VIFETLTLPGAFLLKPERIADDRGFFARMFCSRTFSERGLSPEFRQCSISFNAEKHTLRGMHFQAPPHEEAKLVRCTRGASHHVVLDLRKNSKTYLASASVTLSAENRNLLYAPKGVAHGFITLEPDTEIFYQISTDYVPEAARGVRWDDPAFQIDWPYDPAVISQRDQEFPDFPQAIE
jgi:dTDP-4-dehydrorhamnose 3,5-epimerase